MGGGHTRSRHHRRDELDALPRLLARELGGEQIAHRKRGVLFELSIEPARGVAPAVAALWIGGVFADAGSLEGERVHISGVAAAVLDENGMFGRDFVEVRTRERAAFGGLRVVIFESCHPFANRGFLGIGTDGVLDGIDRSQIAIEAGQMA